MTPYHLACCATPDGHPAALWAGDAGPPRPPTAAWPAPPPGPGRAAQRLGGMP